MSKTIIHVKQVRLSPSIRRGGTGMSVGGQKTFFEKNFNLSRKFARHVFVQRRANLKLPTTGTEQQQ